MVRIRRLGVAALASLASLSAGCLWATPGQGPNRQAHDALEDQIAIDTVASLEEVWTASVDEGSVGDPVTSIRGVHVNDTRNVYRFDFRTGARKWAVGVEAPLEMRQPWIRGLEDVLVSWWNPTATPESDPTTRDVTVSLDAASGSSQGDVGEGVLAGLRDEQAVLWSNEFVRVGGPFGNFPFWLVELGVWDFEASAYACCTPSWFGVFDPDEPPLPVQPMTLGSEWIFHSGEGVLDATTSPPASGNGLRAFSIATPQSCFSAYVCPTWATATDGTSATPPVLSDDQATVYVGTDAGTLYAVEAATGTVQWSAALGSAVTDSPALAHGSLFVPTASGDLVVLDQATGAVLWSGSTGSAITQQPAVAGGVVFTGSADGSLRAFDAAGCGAAACGPLWSASAGSEITGAPAVHHGQLYVGTADGRLIAYGLSTD